MQIQNRIRQRLLVEELTRQRRSDDAELFVEMFRRSTVDPNPHQIEAAMFALRRLAEGGGAMLCDEVGLGKTIEAGLVITQLRSQGRTHVLVIVPLALARQWQVELQDLFSVRSTIVGPSSLSTASTPRGIYIVGRELASSLKGRAWLEKQGPWNLVIIDEAHEMFANIHTRFSKSNGDYLDNLSKGGARRAAQVKQLVDGNPTLLITATPLQNNLYELWGLIQYIDPEQKVLGRFNEFCSLFVTGEGGREVIPEMAETLRRRLTLVLKRTLRRQAQPFMKQPFRARLVHTANFNPEKAEAELYQAVSLWLAKETLAAYRRGHRALMALQLRRRMASSPEALHSTLVSIKERMKKMRETGVYPSKEDLDIELEDLEEQQELGKVDLELLEQDLKEIERIEQIASKIVKAGSDAKKEKLLEITKQIATRSLAGTASDKVVVFTESLKTLESLRTFLENNGFENQVTTFSGSNDPKYSDRALALWQHDVGQFQPVPLDPAAATRAALVHEFKTKTRIFIATEAGAKGLNLQFCNCLINYDLPWNPQRIEQRIGRVHRYGQQHDVLIVNFINLSNEAEQRVYELLETKLHVFTETLGASDTIINTPEIALNLEARVNELLDRCRTPVEIQEAFDRLGLELDEAQRQLHDAHLNSARQLLGELDHSVQARLGTLESELGSALSRCDDTLLNILRADSEIEIVGNDGPRTILKWNDHLYHLGPPDPKAECGEPIHREHPEVQRVIRECLESTDGQVLRVDSFDAGVCVDLNQNSANMDCEGSGKNNSKGDYLVANGDARANEQENPVATTTLNLGAGITAGASMHLNWEIYRVHLHGFEDEECVLAIGPHPLDHVQHHATDLESGLLQLKEKAEIHQREYIDRLLTQITTRKEDLHKYGVASMANLQKKLDQAERARRMAVTREASAKAQAQQKRVQTEMEKLRLESQAETLRRLQEMEEDERRIRLSQFVQTTPKLLFSIEKQQSEWRASV